jgi:hypothetical protein
MSFYLTREQLYDLVWSEAMQKLSKQVGISDVALAKHCRKIGVPVPERGYWNKLQAGKRVVKTALPPRDLVTTNLVEISGNLDADLRARLQGEPGVSDDSTDSIDLLTERFRKRLGTVTVPRDFTRTHPDITKLLEKDEERRQKRLTERFYWREPQFDTPFERRRLRFLNGLWLGFAKVGCKGWIRGESARELSITIGDTHISFTLDRPANARGGRRTRGTDAKADKLCLSLTLHEPPAGMMSHWEDQEGLALEGQITEVVVGMAVAAEQFHRHWIARRIAWERQRREEGEREARRRDEEAVRRERERLAAIEKAKTDALRQSAEAWRASEDIRAYVAKVLEVLKGDVGDRLLAEWSQWALGEASKLDPIASGRVRESFQASVVTSVDEPSA